MPISQTDQLFKLVKSLTKAEKRNFTIYAQRMQSAESLKFMQLFELLDKQKFVTDKVIIEKLNGIKKSHLSNLKRHLYKQILTSLRLIHIQRISSIQIREYVDYAEILYGKGLYIQSLKILAKARQLALKNDYDILLLDITEFQKIIESRHITRTGPSKNQELAAEAHKRGDEVSMMVKLSNLRIIIHGEYIKFGHIRNQKEYDRVKEYFQRNLPVLTNIKDLGYTSKMYLFQSYVWYYYILLEFDKCLEYAKKWVNACKDFPIGIVRDPDIFMRGYHYLLTSAFNLNDVKTYDKYLPELETFRKENYHKFKMNSKIISFLYVHHGRLNRYFLTGDFEEGVKVIPRTIVRINRYRGKLDDHRILVFYFKIAWMFFGAGRPDKTIDFLNRITNKHIENLRADIQGYSRLLFLMAHYDLENYDILDYVFRKVKKFYDNYEEKNIVQTAVLDFFKIIINKPQNEHLKEFQLLDMKLEELKGNPFEQRPFLYLNVPAWVKSKITRKPMSIVIKETLKAQTKSLVRI